MAQMRVLRCVESEWKPDGVKKKKHLPLAFSIWEVFGSHSLFPLFAETFTQGIEGRSVRVNPCLEVDMARDINLSVDRGWLRPASRSRSLFVSLVKKAAGLFWWQVNVGGSPSVGAHTFRDRPPDTFIYFSGCSLRVWVETLFYNWS